MEGTSLLQPRCPCATLWPRFTTNTTSQLRYPFKTNVHRCAQRRPAHVVLRSFTTTTCSYTIISFRPCVSFLCFPIRFRDPPGPTRTHELLVIKLYPACCARPLREAHQANPPCQAPSHCSPFNSGDQHTWHKSNPSHTTSNATPSRASCPSLHFIQLTIVYVRNPSLPGI